MPTAESSTILICVLVYLAACLGIGVWAMRRTHTISDFLVAGKALGPVVLIIAAMSSTMSGFGFVGGPGLVYDSRIEFAVDDLHGAFRFCVFLGHGRQTPAPDGRGARDSHASRRRRRALRRPRAALHDGAGDFPRRSRLSGNAGPGHRNGFGRGPGGETPRGPADRARRAGFL